MTLGSAPQDGDMHRELPLADITGAHRIYSSGWTDEDCKVFTVWFELPDGSLALSTYVLGAPLGQDQRPRIVCGPDQS